MKKQLLIGLLTLGMGLSAQAISLDFVNVTGTSQATSAHLHFLGNGDFTFENATTGSHSGYDFTINGTSVGSVGDSFNLDGNITGTFSIGTISGNTAPVTSSLGATLSIFDGSALFSGLINWIEIEQNGTGENLNINGLVNLTGITYLGSVADLIALKGDQNTASATIAFSFGSPGATIAQLKAGDFKTSYSGDLSSVPEGGPTVTLLGLGMVALGYFARKRKQ